MANVDENTQIALEVVAQTFKLSEQALLRILEALTKLLENKEQDPILDASTKDGKQKISELIKKHEKNGGVIALDENLTKQQLQDYQKELKKLGVDFSVVRNGKEDYSFFFSAAQANVIEKALKNVVERKIAVLEKDEVKKVEKDLNEVRQDLTKEQAEEVKKIYDEITTSEETQPKKNIITYDRLSKQQKLLFAKLEELDEIKRSLFSQDVDLVDKFFANRHKPDYYVEKEISPQTPLDKVKEMVSNLDEKEQTLLQQKVGLVAEEVSDSEYNEMQKNFSPEQIEKVENIFADLLKEVKKESIQENIEEKEIPPQKPLETVKEIISDEIEKKPLEKVKEIVSNLDEKEQTLLQQKVGVVAGKVSENEDKEMQKNFSPEQIEKIDKIVSENISSDIKEGSIVDGKINANVFAALLKKVKNESIKEDIKEKTEVKTDSKDVKDQVKNMLNQLSDEEQKLMIQYTNVRSEDLDNFFADGSRSDREQKKFDEMKSNFTPKQVKKVTAIVDKNVYAGTAPKPEGQIHVDKFKNILTDIRKERAKEDKEKEPKQKKVEFSMNGVKELDTKIKKEQKEISKDKNKKQQISR